MQCTSITSYSECLTPERWNYQNITRPFSIIYYALGGNAFYSIDGAEHPFQKGHLYILPVNRVFSMREDPNDKFYAVYIHAFTSPEIDTVVEVDAADDPFVFQALQMIRRYAKGENAVCMRHLTDMLLSYVFEVLVPSDSSLPVRMKAYIDANFIEVFQTNNLSRRFNYSGSYLSRQFKEKYNVTPKQYAKQLILKEAVLLLERRLSVNETAERLQFSCLENFSRFFKGSFGYSPSQYRKRFRNFPI